MTSAAAVTPKMSPSCMRQGVQPRMCPALRSCIISPATETETQVKAATPRTAAIPVAPSSPSTTIRKATAISTVTVSPLVGLLETPMIPTR